MGERMQFGVFLVLAQETREMIRRSGEVRGRDRLKKFVLPKDRGLCSLKSNKKVKIYFRLIDYVYVVQISMELSKLKIH